MPNNRSMPAAVVMPVLQYDDVRAAVEWLCAAYGFVERLRIGEHRAQLVYGDGCVIVAGAVEITPQGHSVMVRVTDIDDHYERARVAGARILNPPADYPYGERQYSAEDPGGHQWTFSETVADVDPATWGGQLFE